MSDSNSISAWDSDFIMSVCCFWIQFEKITWLVLDKDASDDTFCAKEHTCLLVYALSSAMKAFAVITHVTICLKVY